MQKKEGRYFLGLASIFKGFDNWFDLTTDLIRELEEIIV